MAYQKKKVEPAAANEWMNTYADVVTLLLTFFVLLFAISNVNSKKYDALVKSVNPDGIIVSEAVGALNGGTEVPSSSTEFDAVYKKINDYIQENELQDDIDITKTDDYILLRFKDNVLFNPDKSVLTGNGQAILSFISDALLTTEDKIDQINIEGHTADSIDGNYSAFSWDLSVSRAVNVLRFMVENKGLEPSKLSAVGYSKYRPLADNDTEDGRSQNRRVEIMITQEKGDSEAIQDVVEAVASSHGSKAGTSTVPASSTASAAVSSSSTVTSTSAVASTSAVVSSTVASAVVSKG